METTLIVAHLAPGSEPEIARLFAESDATELPALVGVEERILFSFQDVYIHMVRSGAPLNQGLEPQRKGELFRRISSALDEYIAPMGGRWGTLADASARPFYQWTPASGSVRL